MRRIPTSTYRLQLHKGFSFDDAANVAEYLHELGISHVYCSPYLQAAPGSLHGYDVVDPQRVNAELGGAEAHERFCRRLGEVGLGQVLDIVPNHMSLGQENRYWWDVLENGPSSRYASFFDIDWQPYEERLRNKVLLPVLEGQYGRVLQAGKIKVLRQFLALALVLAGALGNVHDRIVYGSVVDFIEVHIFSYHWPDFNLADSSIVIGSCLLLLDSLLPKKATKQ